MLTCRGTYQIKRRTNGWRWVMGSNGLYDRVSRHFFFSQNQNGLRLLNTSAVDGIIYCAVERDAVTKVEGVEYNLIKNKYVLLLAAGTSLKGKTNDDIKYNILIINLYRVKIITCKRNVFVFARTECRLPRLGLHVNRGCEAFVGNQIVKVLNSLLK